MPNFDEGTIGITYEGMSPSELKEAIRAFNNYYNYQRYHEGLGNVTPFNVYTGRHLVIFQKRRDVKSRTLTERKSYNRGARTKSSDH
jgi:hypothetical protein